MAFLKLALVAVLASAAAECQNCDNEELGLLQAKNQEQQPDWSKILDAAKGAVNTGLGKATGQITQVVSSMNDFAIDAETKFNATLAKYNQITNETLTVAQNLTKFKALVQDTIAKYVPFYTNAVVQVKDALDQSKLLLKTFGPEDLLQKIDDVNATVTAKFSDLARSAGHIADDVSTVAVKDYSKTWSGLKEKLNYISSTTASLNEQFTEKLDAFTGVLEPPLTLALGEKASTRIANLKYTTRQMLMHLQHLTEVYQAGLLKAADDVDSGMTYHENHPGFFKKIFGGLFR